MGNSGASLVVFLSLGLCEELVVRDEPVPVGVGLLEDVLAHALHLLDALLHVIVLVVGIVHFIQLLFEKNLKHKFLFGSKQKLYS